MGRFVNPDNSAFQDVLNSKVYVDKTGLLDYITVLLILQTNLFVIVDLVDLKKQSLQI